jgi:hypothetical protein
MNHLEQFLERTTPTFLRPGATGPAHCPEDEWQQLASKAREYHELRATADFAERLSLGWRPEELAFGVHEATAGGT